MLKPKKILIFSWRYQDFKYICTRKITTKGNAIKEQKSLREKRLCLQVAMK